jgi:hypothetical protein
VITGKFKLYQQDKLLGSYSNIITTQGKRGILRYLAGIDSAYASAIGVGSLSNLPAAPAASDTHLGFEFSRAAIGVRAVDYTNQDVIFKATMPAGFAGKIYELGIFSHLEDHLGGMFKSRVICTFDSSEGWTSGGTIAYDAVNNRVSFDSILTDITTGSGTQTYTLGSYYSDLSGYSNADSFGLTFITYYDYVSAITLTFTSITGTTFAATFTPATHTAGSNIPQAQLVKINKSAFTNASLDWSNITSIQVAVAAKASASVTNRAKVALDGLRLYDNDSINSQYALVSRATVVTPIVKATNIPMDIEYRMRFAL